MKREFQFIKEQHLKIKKNDNKKQWLYTIDTYKIIQAKIINKHKADWKFISEQTLKIHINWTLENNCYLIELFEHLRTQNSDIAIGHQKKAYS